MSTPAEQLELSIIPTHLAIKAMRDSGYRTTAHAIAELIDNSQQAGAKEISVFCFESAEIVAERTSRRVKKLAVLDDGEGMDTKVLSMALQFGNGTRLEDRTGIGRFGMGLPNASISQARRVDVWTWKNGPTNALHSFLDIDKIQRRELINVPPPTRSALPESILGTHQITSQSGTLVVWTELDPTRLTWRGAKATLSNTEQLVGRVHRRFINQGDLVIRLITVLDEEIDNETLVRPNDPLYLMSGTSTPEPFDGKPMFDAIGTTETFAIDYAGATHEVKVNLSLASRATLDQSSGLQRGDTKYGKHAAHNVGVSLVRAGRELTIDRGWAIAYDPRERWWGAEVDFPPALDEIFGVTNNKQEATIFSSLANFRLEEDAEQGESIVQYKQRLKEYGDPRAELIEVAEYLQRQLKHLRGLVKEQGKGRRSTSNRHNETDDVTQRASDGFKRRAEDGYAAPTDRDEISDDDLNEIKADLENKRYEEPEASKIVNQIRANHLKCVFLRADQDSSAFFSVEEKPGGLTEIVFNQRHPAFEVVWGTLESSIDVDQLSSRELLENIESAHDAMKLLFAAWARYEVEESFRSRDKFRKIRQDWGIIASQFLRPDEFDG